MTTLEKKKQVKYIYDASQAHITHYQANRWRCIRVIGFLLNVANEVSL